MIDAEALRSGVSWSDFERKLFFVDYCDTVPAGVTNMNMVTNEVYEKFEQMGEEEEARFLASVDEKLIGLIRNAVRRVRREDSLQYRLFRQAAIRLSRKDAPVNRLIEAAGVAPIDWWANTIRLAAVALACVAGVYAIYLAMIVTPLVKYISDGELGGVVYMVACGVIGLYLLLAYWLGERRLHAPFVRIWNLVLRALRLDPR